MMRMCGRWLWRGSRVKSVNTRWNFMRCFASTTSHAYAVGTRGILRDRINAALVDMLDSKYSQYSVDLSEFDGTVFPIAKPEKFGDYQCNICMPLAKHLKDNPRTIAAHLMEYLQVGDVAEISVAGPGFLNFRLVESFVKSSFISVISDSTGRLGVHQTAFPKRTIVDYSSPNVAKEMHVGHLRSTIIGDTLSNIIEFLGHDVVRINHIGDWGTQFGMLIEFVRTDHPEVYCGSVTSGAEGTSGELEAKIGDLSNFYKKARARFDSDEEFRKNARLRVVELQQLGLKERGEKGTVQTEGGEAFALWRNICAMSRRDFKKTYEMLGIKKLVDRGESFYNPMLPDVVDYCLRKEIAALSDGAVCIFPRRDDESADDSPPLMIQKSDGGYLYATTDIAAVMHRVWVEEADRILYVTDLSQAEHFRMLFDTADRIGLNVRGENTDQSTCNMITKMRLHYGVCDVKFERSSKNVELLHVGFGLVLGDDNKKLKSRAGDAVRLHHLLLTAVERSRIELQRRQKQVEEACQHNTSRLLSDVEIDVAAEVIGLGAVKYADLSMNREGNYRFSYDKMLSMSGNTAPYLLYAYARIKGIQRQVTEAHESSVLPSSTPALHFEKQEEYFLAKHIIRFEETLLEVERTLLPNKLCEYLYELAIRFNSFYETCSVLHGEISSKTSRLLLCKATADTLKLGLKLLSINTIEKL